MINKSHFGKHISALRRKSGLSQTELAEILGVTSQAISKCETGSSIPDIDLLLELSHFYNTSINEMLEDNDLLYKLTGKKRGADGITYFISNTEKKKILLSLEPMRVNTSIVEILLSLMIT